MAPVARNNLEEKMTMNRIRTLSRVALALMLSTGLMAAPAIAHAAEKPSNVATMDTNKDGKIDKQEYLAYMGAQFDKYGASKGFCTYAEIETGARSGFGVWGPNIGP